MTDKQKAFLQLYEPIHNRFERFCRARAFDDMDYCDLINDSLLVAFEKFETLRLEQAFLSFLCGISIRIIGNYHQKKKTTRFGRSDNILDIKDENSNPQLKADIHYLYKALAQLSDEQRESIILFEITGFSIKEIMVIQNASESAVKQRLKRGRQKLTEMLTFEVTTTNGNQKNG